MKDYFVYILQSKNGTALYIGVTNNLERRYFEHKNELIDGFTKKYKCKKLIYYEITNSIESAIAREKQLKKWSRNKKLELISKMNPDLSDLSTALEMTGE
jgi:putative endonuclease